MRKNLVMFLVLGLVVAMSTTAMAAVNFIGAAGSDISVLSNWTANPHNVYYTEEARIDQTMVGALSSAVLDWDRMRIKGGTLNVSGGDLEFKNYTGSGWIGLALFRGVATINMTGGSVTADLVNLGAGLYDAPGAGSDGIGVVDIWGDADFVVQKNDYPSGAPGGRYWLEIWDGSSIDIRDDGELRVPNEVDIVAHVDDYIAGGKILTGTGAGLTTFVDGNQYVVAVIPEPGTMLLLCLGLGSLALIRRR